MRAAAATSATPPPTAMPTITPMDSPLLLEGGAGGPGGAGGLGGGGGGDCTRQVNAKQSRCSREQVLPRRLRQTPAVADARSLLVLCAAQQLATMQLQH